jgi:hypothetical protein
MSEANEQSTILELLSALCAAASDENPEGFSVEAMPGGRRLRLIHAIAGRQVTAAWPHPAADAAIGSPSIVYRLRRRLAELAGLPMSAEVRETPEGVAETWDLIVGTPPGNAVVVGIHGVDAGPGDALIVSPSSPGFDARVASTSEHDPDVPIEGETRRVVETMAPMVLCTAVVVGERTEFSFRPPVIRCVFPSDPLEIMRGHSEMQDLLQNGNAAG